MSGDAIKDYPNLAALPTRSWKGMIFDNKIYAKKVIVQLTRLQQNQYGSLTQAGYQYSYDMNTGIGWYPSMFGAPNLWAVDSSRPQT